MTLQRYFGDGPYNKYMIEEHSTNCQKYWYAVLLHIQNFVNPDELCMGHTWYLSTDFQLYILAPIFVYPLWKFGKRILVTLPILCLASVIFIFLASFEHGFRAFELNK